MEESKTQIKEAGTETLSPHLTGLFFKRVESSAEKPEIVPEKDFMKNMLTKEVKMKEFNERLLKTRQEKVIIKEILLESEIDLINSLKQLKTVFRDELKTAIDKLNDLYNNEILKLQQLYRSEVIGDKLLEIVNKISPSGWYLIMKSTSVQFCKFYQPAHAVTTGVSVDKHTTREYEETVCYLKAIYVNALHSKITSGSIHLSTEDQHPNADRDNFASACVGDFEDREIPLEDPDRLLVLLNEISDTYEQIHLDSCYYEPDIQYKTKKDEKWTAAG